MGPDESFEKLVRELDDDALACLRRAVAHESGQRRQQAALRMEDIHPNMSPAEKLRATEYIARLLQGEE
jgi:hypothetical protein